jgi:hypothetical protein
VVKKFTKTTEREEKEEPKGIFPAVNHPLPRTVLTQRPKAKDQRPNTKGQDAT